MSSLEVGGIIGSIVAGYAADQLVKHVRGFFIFTIISIYWLTTVVRICLFRPILLEDERLNCKDIIFI